MEKKKVLVTGIGGNVGQGIIRNILKTNFPIKVIGCNVTEFSAGNHLCDVFYRVPYAMDPLYIKEINYIVEKEKIDLILPSTDYEVYYLSKHKNELKCNVVVSELSTAERYLDKYKSFLFHKEKDLPFANSFLPEIFDINSLENIIVKPREGRGSRGISINPTNLDHFTNEYMVQELVKGKEITTAFYVNKENKLHGFINLERKLDNGATNECWVNRNYDLQLENILNKIIKHNNFIGSANLQSIVTDSGEIVPFEINCRISGTNSIRSNFGFEDVKYTLEEHLYNIELSEPKIIEGSAVRIMMDIIYPNNNKVQTLRDNQSEHYIF